jgi:hypothetical protein
MEIVRLDVIKFFYSKAGAKYCEPVCRPQSCGSI